MAELSPQAQAVRDAFDTASIDTSIFGDPDRRLASALQAAAERLGYRIIYGDSDAYYIVDVADLLAIAAELEGA